MTDFALTGEHRRRLQLVAKHGADQVSRSMSRWLKETIQLTVGAVEVVHFSEVAGRLAHPDETVAAVMLRLGQDLTGTSLFLFDEASAFEIVRRVLRRDRPPDEWDELARSAMEETGNIVGSAFLNGLALALNLEVHPDAPVFVVDFAQAVLDPLMIDVAMTGEYALLFEAEVVSVSGTIRGRFGLLPESACLDRLLGSI